MLSCACEEKFWQLLCYTVHNGESKQNSIRGPAHRKFELFLILQGQKWVVFVALEAAVNDGVAINVTSLPDHPDKVFGFFDKPCIGVDHSCFVLLHSDDKRGGRA